MALGRPSESIVASRLKRARMLEKYEELVAEGVRCHEAARAIGYQHTTVNRWLKEQREEEEQQQEAQRMTAAGGSFAAALERLRAGQMVRRRSAQWFLQIVDGKVCLYLIDGGGNRRYSRVATFGSADVLSMDWEIYNG